MSKEKSVTFIIEGRGDMSVGIWPTSNEVTITIKDYDDDPDWFKEFVEAQRELLKEFFESDTRVGVMTKDEYEAMCKAEFEEEYRLDKMEEEITKEMEENMKIDDVEGRNDE